MCAYLLLSLHVVFIYASKTWLETFLFYSGFSHCAWQRISRRSPNNLNNVHSRIFNVYCSLKQRMFNKHKFEASLYVVSRNWYQRKAKRTIFSSIFGLMSGIGRSCISSFTMNQLFGIIYCNSNSIGCEFIVTNLRNCEFHVINTMYAVCTVCRLVSI